MRVRYQKERATWNVFAKRPQVAVVKTKWCGWSYEKEWRLMFDLKNCRKSKEKNRNVFFIPLDYQQVKTVILGCRCPESLQKRVKKLLQSDNLSHVKCLKAEIDESGFKLNFKRCFEFAN